MTQKDYLVSVCANCRQASCWHGEFMCQSAATATVIDVPASDLDKEHREHPSYYSRERLMEVCGYIQEIDLN